MVVNVWEKLPVERRIFSAAHELGHLVLHQNSLDMDQTEEDKAEEAEANSFADHFLMPNEGFIKDWNEAAGLSMVDRVFKIKRLYSVSYKAVLHRLIALGAADKTVWQKFKRHLSKKIKSKPQLQRRASTLY